MTSSSESPHSFCLKRFFRISLIGGILLALCCMVQIGNAAQYGNFTYEIAGNTVKITDYPTNATGSVVIPAMIEGKSVSSIGDSAFASCTYITSVTIPSGVTIIPQSAFASCHSLTSVTLPASVRSIGSYAFYRCLRLQGLSLPPYVTDIGNFAFNGCALTSVNIPASTGWIGNLAFGDCTELTSFTVATANPTYASVNGVLFNKQKTALIKCPAKKTGAYSIPSSVTSIEDHAFEQCAKLTGITIPSSVTSIGSDAFSFCESLTTVVLPSSVTSIANGVFSYCYGLKKITIPASVTSIEGGSFFNCEALENVTIPASVTSIGGGAFADCTSLISIGVDPNNPNFTSVDGLLFDKSKSTLLQYPAGNTGDFAVPFGTLSIGYSAFGGCDKVSHISIPSTVTSIQAFAFRGCRALTSIIIPASVTSIGNAAFDYCGSLTQITFTGDAPTMGASVFGTIAANVTVNYYNNNAGFTSPTWMGYPSVDLGELIATPADINVQYPVGTDLLSGGASNLFGAVTVGGKSSVVLTIKNTGTVDLTGLAVAISGDHSDDFQISELNAIGLVGGDSTTLQVSFTPTNLGARSALIQISSNDSDENPFEILVTGTGKAPPVPEISVQAPAGKDLLDGGTGSHVGTVNLGGTASMVLTIKNVGNSNLTGLAISKSGANPSDFQLTSLSSTTLAGGASASIRVDFTPSALGARAALIRIASNDADENPFDIQLTGTGKLPPVPEISVQAPAGKDLLDGGTGSHVGTVALGGTASMVLTIKNVGNSNLTGLAISKSGANPSDFQLTSLSSTTLAGGASALIRVDFSPSALGARAALIRITSNDADENPFDIQLTGTGVAVPVPEIAVSQPVGRNLADGKAKKSFGTMKVGNAGNVRTFTIKNKGTGTLTKLAITKNGTAAKDFIVSPLTKTFLPAGASATFKVKFKPTAKGTRDAAIHIKSNDANESPFDIKLTGLGVPK